MSRGQTHGGKGDKQRPTDKKKYEDNYDAIFGKKKTGGCDYVRCSANGDEEMLTIYTDYPHEVIRLHAKWGTYGKEGDEPLRYVTIAGLNPYHLRAILDTQQKTMRPAMYKVMQDEVEYRNEN